MTSTGWTRRCAVPRADALLAAGLLVACEGEIVIDAARHKAGSDLSVAIHLGVVAVFTTAVAWRRRAPLASAATSVVGLAVLISTWSHDPMLNAPQLMLFITPFSVGAFATRARALAGLAVCLVSLTSATLIKSGPTSGWAFGIIACVAAWGAGRLMQARRATGQELQRTIALIEAEREGRELLAVAEQRTRIAQELQALVAQSVSTMIVQAQAAGRLVAQGADDADAAMATVEATGREALVEMRRILGVLRHADEAPDLAPQPGVGQISTLVEQARAALADITLEVVGTPGSLPASVDLGVYRVLEEVLGSVEASERGPIEIVLRFGDEDVAMEVTSPTAHLDWPTPAMHERVALCRGDIDTRTVAGGGERLSLRLPRAFDEAFA